jgi:hypothetical protein
MNASKEECQNAILTVNDALEEIEERAPHLIDLHTDLEGVKEFLGAALRKLPTEAAYAADKAKSRLRKKVSV